MRWYYNDNLFRAATTKEELCKGGKKKGRYKHCMKQKSNVIIKCPKDKIKNIKDKRILKRNEFYSKHACCKQRKKTPKQKKKRKNKKNKK